MSLMLMLLLPTLVNLQRKHAEQTCLENLDCMQTAYLQRSKQDIFGKT